MGDITISGGGSSAVATDSMLESARTLAVLAHAAAGWGQQLWSSAAHSPPGVSGGAEHYIHRARAATDDIEVRSSHLREKLHTAAEAYGMAERAATAAAEAGGSLFGYAAGAAAPLFGLFIIGALPGLGLAFGAATLAAGSPAGAARGFSRWLSAHSGVLRNPAVVSLVRTTVSSVDDGMLGAAGVPYPIARALDDRATGLFGLRGAARSVVAAASPIALTETPVTVSQTRSSTASAPTGFHELAERVPSNAAGDPQVRVERYDVAGSRPRWVVYVGGTVDTGFVADGEPWDDTSNLNGVAGLSSGSVRATEMALCDAGAQPGDVVMPVGYSQGGIAATTLATSGEYTTPVLVTFGSPTSGIDVPSTVADVAVEHSDDIIPALGGLPRAPDDGGIDRILVQRLTSDTPQPLDGDPLGAHHIGEYAETAGQMDDSSDPRLAEARAKLLRYTAGGPAEVTMWRGERVQG